MYTLIALLATLVASTPVPDGDDGQLLTRAKPLQTRFHWRYGGTGIRDRRFLATCGHGPVVGFRNGDTLAVTDEALYCSVGWEVSPTTIVSGLNPTVKRCIDSTLYPGNGVQPHMWDCYDGAWQQQWTHHPDGRIELVGKGLCLDVTDGDPTKPVQMWECVPGNRNQQWDLAPP